MTPFPVRVISTLSDGRVSVMGPSARMVQLLKEGGGLYCIAHSPRHGACRLGLRDWLRDHASPDVAAESERTGYLPLPLARAWEIAKYVRDPAWCRGLDIDREAMAARWVDAKTHGGLSETEAVLLIWEYSRAAGAIPAAAAMPDLVHEADLDWRYRSAWRRSTNGGPIWIDEDKAREIDEARMWEAYEHGKAA